MLTRYNWVDSDYDKSTYFSVFMMVCITPFTILIDLIFLIPEIITYIVYKFMWRDE